MRLGMSRPILYRTIMGHDRCVYSMPAPPCGGTGIQQVYKQACHPAKRCQYPVLEPRLANGPACVPSRVGEAHKQVSLYGNSVALIWQARKQTRLCPS